MQEKTIDQIWYTWSTIGVDNVSAGFRVRAASDNLSDLHGTRYRGIAGYLRYQLPRGVNPNVVLPEDAPISLALINAPDGRILVQKVYIGQDGVGRAGNYSAHLLAHLPDSFSARQAIRLWKSRLWKEHDVTEEEQPLLLPLLPLAYVKKHGAKQNFHFEEIRQPLLEIIMVFLSRAGEPQRLFIDGDSEHIAMLIWGLTHSLPITLLPPKFTFSTYEDDIDRSLETIIGTITANKLLAPNHGSPHMEYDPPPQRISDSQLEVDIAKYAEFAVRCLVETSDGRSQQLDHLVENAERVGIKTIEAFMQLFLQIYEQPKVLINNLIRAIRSGERTTITDLCNKLTTLFPPDTNHDVWDLLLRSLSQKDIYMLVMRHWPLRKWLLSSLAVISPQPQNKDIYPWLVVSWDMLDELQTLDLPYKWYKLAIRTIILEPVQQMPSNGIEIFKKHQRGFIEVLQRFVTKPEEMFTTSVLAFIQTLKKNNYSESTALISTLLHTEKICPPTEEQLKILLQQPAPLNPQNLPSVENELASPTSSVPIMAGSNSSVSSSLKIVKGQLFAVAIEWSKQQRSKLTLGLSIFLILDMLLLLISLGMIFSAKNSPSKNSPNEPAIRATVIAQITGTVNHGLMPDSYTLILKSGNPTVKLGATVQLYLILRNSGTNTWSDPGYKLICILSVTNPQPDPDCAGGTPQRFKGNVPPGQYYLFLITLKASSDLKSLGQHHTLWNLENKDTLFSYSQPQELDFTITK